MFCLQSVTWSSVYPDCEWYVQVVGQDLLRPGRYGQSFVMQYTGHSLLPSSATRARSQVGSPGDKEDVRKHSQNLKWDNKVCCGEIFLF